jgi:hypothetical protein
MYYETSVHRPCSQNAGSVQLAVVNFAIPAGICPHQMSARAYFVFTCVLTFARI